MTLREVHRWGGWVLGAFLILQALTGLVSAFRGEINGYLYEASGASAHAADPGPSVRAGAIVADFVGRFPDLTFERLFFPDSLMDDAAVVWARDASRDLHVAVYDPETAALVKAGPMTAFPAELIFFLHVQLLSGPAGQIAVGLLGVLLVVMSVTGYVRWRKTRKLPKVNPTRVSEYGRWLLRHRTLGIALAALAVLLGATGGFLGLKVMAAPASTGRAPRLDGPVDASIIDRAVRTVAERSPNRTLWSLTLEPAEPQRVTVLVRRTDGLPPRATDQLTIGPDGAVVDQVSFRQQPMKSRLSAWAHGLHSGEWLGILGKPLMILAAFGLGAMAIIGYALTAMRTRRSRA